MGCGSSNMQAKNPSEKPKPSNSTSSWSDLRSIKAYKTSNSKSSPSTIPKPPPYSFPKTYNPDLSFQLTVKTLRGVPPFTLPGVKPRLTGRELHELIKNTTKNPEEMLLVLYGRIIRSDEVEIGKKGLSENATVYCVYKPKEKGSS